MTPWRNLLAGIRAFAAIRKLAHLTHPLIYVTGCLMTECRRPPSVKLVGVESLDRRKAT